MDQLLKTNEVAAALGVRPATIRRWVLLRQIEFVKVGKSVRFEPRLVARLIAAGRVRPSRKATHDGR